MSYENNQFIIDSSTITYDYKNNSIDSMSSYSNIFSADNITVYIKGDLIGAILPISDLSKIFIINNTDINISIYDMQNKTLNNCSLENTTTYYGLLTNSSSVTI